MAFPIDLSFHVHCPSQAWFRSRKIVLTCNIMSGAIALEPTLTRTATFRHEPEGDEESAPLIVEDTEEPLDSALDPEVVRPEGRMGDNVAQIVAYVSAKHSSGRGILTRWKAAVGVRACAVSPTGQFTHGRYRCSCLEHG